MNIVEFKTILKNYSVEQWIQWINDMFRYGVAHPGLPPSDDDDITDPIAELSRFFKKFEVSSVEYQRALFHVLAIHIMENSNVTTDTSKKLSRILLGLSVIAKSDIGESLAELFSLKKYEKYPVHHTYLKSYILELLSKSTLSQEKRDEVMVLAKEYLPIYVMDPKYCSGLLRLSHRQYVPADDIFFENFILILQTIKEGELTPDMKVHLIDKFEEFQYHQKDVFQKGFSSWFERLNNARHHELFSEDFKKFRI